MEVGYDSYAVGHPCLSMVGRRFWVFLPFVGEGGLSLSKGEPLLTEVVGLNYGKILFRVRTEARPNR